MNKLMLLFASLIVALLFQSCGKSYTHDAAGMKMLQQDLLEKFGTDVWYTNISYSVSPDNKNIYVVSADLTDNPESLTQDRWLKEDNTWQKIAKVNLDIQNGAPRDYMFQLDHGQINLETLGQLITGTRNTLEKEKNISGLKLRIAVVATSNVVLNQNERFSYTVILEDESGNTFSTTYDLDGKVRNRNF
jgi:hypothetical protein